MLDKLEAAAIEAIQKAMQEIKADSGKLETRILNVEYNMGRFSALMEIIKEINTVRFISLADQTVADRDRILKFIDRIYSIRLKEATEK